MNNEYELRLVCPPGYSFPEGLVRLCQVVQQQATVADSWYVPGHVASFERHERWVATGGAAPIRIRRDSSDDRAACHIEVKRLGSPGDYSAAQEVALPCADPETAHMFLTTAGYVHVIDISKMRTTYHHPDGVWLSVDDYGGRGSVLEIEGRSVSGTAEEVLSYLRGWAHRNLGASLAELHEPYVLTMIRDALRSAELTA